jgi:hypothetical protein
LAITNRGKGYLRASVFGALLILASCVADRQDAADAAVTINLANSGSEPLRCQLIYGHWVERPLGEIAPGASVKVELMRAVEDGGLYNMRPDGQKKMMVENVICGRLDGWKESLGQVDLNELRRRAASHVAASCAAPAGAGRIACRLDQISE